VIFRLPLSLSSHCELDPFKPLRHKIPNFGQWMLQQLSKSFGPNFYDVSQRARPTHGLDSGKHHIDDALLVHCGFQQAFDGRTEDNAFGMF